ncbi:hypothetical protein MY092_005799 [Salmonella enterica]|nr:hypothetical protein [Salmonella enterica]
MLNFKNEGMNEHGDTELGAGISTFATTDITDIAAADRSNAALTTFVSLRYSQPRAGFFVSAAKPAGNSVLSRRGSDTPFIYQHRICPTNRHAGNYGL